MKKLILIASLSLAAIAVAPIASASAAVEGSCVISGKAKFEKGLLSQPLPTESPLTRGYEFKGPEGEINSVAGSKCVENNGTEHAVEEVSVTGGEFEGSCVGPGKSTKNGVGSLKVNGVIYSFELSFTSDAGIVSLHVFPKGSITEEAKGVAEFFTSIKQPAGECATGVDHLEFTAAVTGKIS